MNRQILTGKDIASQDLKLTLNFLHATDDYTKLCSKQFVRIVSNYKRTIL